MSTRKIHQAPTYTEVHAPEERKSLLLEIRKLKPETEVSIEGFGDLATGKIIDWDENKKLFTVRWTEIPKSFEDHSASRTGLRSFFKVKLFSTQVVFKCEIVRRLPDGTYHYRVPTGLYKNQKRRALRVPLPPGAGKILTPSGALAILDLSASGAKLSIPETFPHRISKLENCTLVLGSMRLSTPEFGITLTHRATEWIGCRFHGLNEAIHVEIKQYLIEALHSYFKELSP